MPLAAAVAHAKSPNVRAAVHALYADLSQLIAARKPRCDASGRCCHFDAYGHRLYVTTAELATFVSDLDSLPPSPSPSSPTSLPVLASSTPASPDCPFLASNLCSVHTIRPFGCQIYFCDPTATSWMEDTYAAFHGRLRELHDRHGLEYHYVEWRTALAQLGKDVLRRGI